MRTRAYRTVRGVRVLFLLLATGVAAIILPMHWILEPDAKPEPWKLVIVQCEDRAGKILELEGFWTGCDWRIVGDKNRRKYLRVKMWASKLGGRV